MLNKDIENFSIDIMANMPDLFLLEHHVEIKIAIVEALKNTLEHWPTG